MRLPPEDGTPYPRRYCGNCYYNLHGLDTAERCPECGEPVPSEKASGSVVGQSPSLLSNPE